MNGDDVMNNENWSRNGGGGFITDDGTLAIIKCPECRKENYAMNVTSGICTWCGHEEKAMNNKKQSIQKRIDQDILQTPTVNTRNKLTEINILFQEIIEEEKKLKEEITDLKMELFFRISSIDRKDSTHPDWFKTDNNEAEELGDYLVGKGKFKKEQDELGYRWYSIIT